MAKLAHHVFFTLKDRSQPAVDNLIAAVQKYLPGHDGVIDFAVGVRDKELDRPVNADFDVSLHMVFADRPSHDAYQVAETHQKFISENKDTWAGVAIFDSTVL